MTPLRILQVTPYYEHAWGYGGIPRVATSISRGLAKRGHHVTVCTTDACDANSRVNDAQTRAEGAVKVLSFPNVSNQVAYRFQFFTPQGMLAFLLRHASEFDIAHLHGFHHLPGVIAAAALARAQVPYLVAPNGVAGRMERRIFAKWLFDVTLGSRVLPQAAGAIAVSEAERGQLVELGVPADKIYVVPNPIDLAEFDPPPQKPSSSLHQRFGGRFEQIVLYLGTLTPRKSVDVLVRALGKLREQSIGLMIAGNDLGSGAGLRALVQRLGLTDQVKFAGQLVGRQRLEMLASADAVAYAGRAEIFGLVPLEAILSGTPVVVASDSGCGQVIDRVGGGLLVPPDDANALARALSNVLASPATWRETISQAQPRVRELYSSEVVAAAMEEVYLRIVKPRTQVAR